MHRVVFIVGATSVGKSGAALKLAERSGAEIVNADAFQIYRGLRLLTSQPGAEVRRQVPHHLFGMVHLSAAYNVALYRRDAVACIQEVSTRDKPVVVVGGTGLYIKALTHGLSPLPPADPVLRLHLEGRELGELLGELQKVDPEGAIQIDRSNKRRVVRALEVSLLTGEPFSSFREAWNHSAYGAGAAGIFLDREREDLRSRIDQQVEAMFDAGVIEEVEAVDAGSLGITAAAVIGFAEIKDFLAGKNSLQDCKERVKARTARYAKRQVTWFKKESVFRRFGLSPSGDNLEDALAFTCETIRGQR